MANKGESDKHRLLKEFAAKKLNDLLGVPERFIHEEFAFGEFRFDVAAVPPPEVNGPMTIAVECGRKKGTALKNKAHFEDALKYVDTIFWIPYSIYDAAYFDLFQPIYETISTPPINFPIHDKKYSSLSNIVTEDDVVSGMMVVRRGRFPEFDNWQYKAESDI